MKVMVFIVGLCVCFSVYATDIKSVADMKMILEQEKSYVVTELNNDRLLIQYKKHQFILKDYKDGDVVFFFFLEGLKMKSGDINDWNNEVRFSKLYLDSDNDVVLEFYGFANAVITQESFLKVVNLFANTFLPMLFEFLSERGYLKTESTHEAHPKTSKLCKADTLSGMTAFCLENPNVLNNAGYNPNAIIDLLHEKMFGSMAVFSEKDANSKALTDKIAECAVYYSTPSSWQVQQINDNLIKIAMFCKNHYIGQARINLLNRNGKRSVTHIEYLTAN